MKTVSLALILAMITLASEVHAQTGETSSSATRTMASLLTEGYEVQETRLFKDKIWMRKAGGEGLAFICDRGRIGSAAFDAYREKKYDQISCSLSP